MDLPLKIYNDFIKDMDYPRYTFETFTPDPRDIGDVRPFLERECGYAVLPTSLVNKIAIDARSLISYFRKVTDEDDRMSSLSAAACLALFRLVKSKQNVLITCPDLNSCVDVLKALLKHGEVVFGIYYRWLLPKVRVGDDRKMPFVVPYEMPDLHISHFEDDIKPYFNKRELIEEGPLIIFNIAKSPLVPFRSHVTPGLFICFDVNGKVDSASDYNMQKTFYPESPISRMKSFKFPKREM